MRHWLAGLMLLVAPSAFAQLQLRGSDTLEDVTKDAVSAASRDGLENDLEVHALLARNRVHQALNDVALVVNRQLDRDAVRLRPAPRVDRRRRSVDVPVRPR